MYIWNERTSNAHYNSKYAFIFAICGRCENQDFSSNKNVKLATKTRGIKHL